MYVLGERDLYDAFWNLRMNERSAIWPIGACILPLYSGERNQKREREEKLFFPFSIAPVLAAQNAHAH